MIVIGLDAHKRTHTLAALDAVTGVNKGEATVQADKPCIPQATSIPDAALRLLLSAEVSFAS